MSEILTNNTKPPYDNIKYPGIDELENMEEVPEKKEIKLDRLPPVDDTIEILLSFAALAWRNKDYGINLRKWKKVDIILLGIIGWWIVAYIADYKYEILPEDELKKV
ncbi:hypothetical protein AN640_08655 [Candidatus Epulonipiscium fishelsonii]|uniref:Uncharacterized protein n=1 Tax=Candidatus Epulonipiscium fishelsonii TaxID=77094 RepID=A0ACC8XCR1_9FIRM|nr:hypothetical protein AN640_08655 [Epulopiscium sp. SCG-D08WGA-EpuloA1]OON96315.1 MAG: hypothetical protein ATN32_06495 [Epulopiscium sp. AS2M-Bin002]